jgi:hypothetical protein
MTIICEAGIARPTDTGVEGAIDVVFVLTLPDGTEHDGECTLVANESSGDFGSWGGIDHWLDSRTVGVISALPEFGDLRDAILVACGAEADRVQS